MFSFTKKEVHLEQHFLEYKVLPFLIDCLTNVMEHFLIFLLIFIYILTELESVFSILFSM